MRVLPFVRDDRSGGREWLSRPSGSNSSCRSGKLAPVDELKDVLAAVGPKLRDLRKQRGTTLAELSRKTGISESTLSRLEGGGRRPNLELLLPLARAYD